MATCKERKANNSLIIIIKEIKIKAKLALFC